MDLTRRRLLQAGSVLTAGLIAGCSGNESADSTGTTAPTTTEAEGTAETLPAPSMGDSEAPVIVESFEDFLCKYCAQFSLQIVPQIEAAYIESGEVLYRRHDFPFLDEEWSWKTANAARAVQDTEGDEAFFEFVDRLYADLDSYSLDRFAEVAGTVGAEPETVRNAANEGRYGETLNAEKELGLSHNVTKTPTVLVNGSRPESPRFEDVATAIDAALETE